MSQRPLRLRKQPKKDYEKIELNLELIEKNETKKKKGSEKEELALMARTLCSFINSTNRSYNRHEKDTLENLEDKKIHYSPPLLKQKRKQAERTQNNQEDKVKKRVKLDLGEVKNNLKISKKEEPEKTLQNQKRKNGKENDEKRNQFAKRAMNHISIAYSIYVRTIVEKGISFDRQEQFDPTYRASLVRNSSR